MAGRFLEQWKMLLHILWSHVSLAHTRGCRLLAAADAIIDMVKMIIQELADIKSRMSD